MKPTASPGTAPEVPPIRRGWKRLPCPRCGASDVNVTLILSDVETFTCGDCDQEFAAEEIRDIIRQWAPVLQWPAHCPPVEE